MGNVRASLRQGMTIESSLVSSATGKATDLPGNRLRGGRRGASLARFTAAERSNREHDRAVALAIVLDDRRTPVEFFLPVGEPSRTVAANQRNRHVPSRAEHAAGVWKLFVGIHFHRATGEEHR